MFDEAIKILQTQEKPYSTAIAVLRWAQENMHVIQQNQEMKSANERREKAFGKPN